VLLLFCQRAVRSQQALHTSQIQRTDCRAEHPLHAATAAKLRPPQASHLFDPAEYLLHPFAFSLTFPEPGIIPFLGPQPVRPVFRLHRVLGQMRHHPALPQPGDKTRRILGGRASSKEKVVPGPSPTSTYKHGQRFHVHIADASNPVTNGLHDFDIEDETYNHYWIDPKVHVLLTTDDATSERVIAWSHKYKRSRIVYIELGHGPSAYENMNYRTLVQQAIVWVGGK
jgi:hypothetical protein